MTLQKTISHVEEKPIKYEESKKSGGFLGKLRRKDKDRSNSKDRLYPSKSTSNLLVSSMRTNQFQTNLEKESPVSPVTAFLQDQNLSVTNAITPQFHGIDPKFRPIKPSEAQKFVVVTANNETFTVVNINEASSVEEAKIMIGNGLNIQDWALCSFHLTDFGCKEGHALDDSTFYQLIFNPQKFGTMNELLKLYVSYIPDYDPSTSPGSLSLEYVFATNTRQYPSTPAYMINQESTIGPKGQPPLPPPKHSDYFSPKPPYEESMLLTVPQQHQQSLPQSHSHQNHPQWQHFKLPTRQASSKTKRKESSTLNREQSKGSFTDEYKDNNNLAVYNKSSLGSLFENHSRKSSEDSFKVIRPERREINFDDRRASPYDRRPSFDPRRPSIPIQTGNLTPNAAASIKQRPLHQVSQPNMSVQPVQPVQSVKSSQSAQHIRPVNSARQNTPPGSSTSPSIQTNHSHNQSASVNVPNQPNNNRKPSVKLDRNSSQTSRNGAKLERTNSQLVAMRSAPPPPPSTGSGLQRVGSKIGRGYGASSAFNSGRHFANESSARNMARQLTTEALVSGSSIAVIDSSAKIARQASVRGSKEVKRIPSGPPRIDLGDFHSMGFGADLGLGIDDYQNGTSFFSTAPPATSSPAIAPNSDSTRDEKFLENEISFANAPELEESDDDSSSSDEGLWAKKPPVPETSDPPLASESSRKQKPQLHVRVASNVESGEQPGRGPASPLPSKSGHYFHDVKLGGWAVRPPAEVVYENLERFFPDADLDGPIIIDTHGTSPPASPSNDPVVGRLAYHPPLSPVNEPPKDMSKYHKTSSESLGPSYTPQFQHTKTLSVPPSPVSAVSPLPGRLPQSDNIKPGTSVAASSGAIPVNDLKAKSPGSSYGGVSDSTGGATNHQVPVVEPKTGLTMRTKSLRIVVQEASARRQRFQSLASANNKSGALLRRKSTKMWGQKVVEVKPSEMKRGQFSRLRDNKGDVKQFAWVKGELIGKGSFGKVYLALNATAGEMIAVKQVEVPQTVSDKSSAKQREIIDTLHSEVETMKDLDHFNIVQYLGFEALPDFYNLFLEYVPGGSVGSALRKHGRFEEMVIKSLTRQVLDALSYLHSCGILHRDLKSDNLLIDLDGVCKISDFGISKKSRNIYTNDAEMSMQGTIFWMAPEVIHNVVHNEKQGYSAKIDIWSLGCVVLEMFAGRRPWSNDEAIGAMYKLGNARLAPPIPEDTIPFVSEDGIDIIDKCFSIDPEQRPTAAQLLLHPFCVIPRNFRFQDTQLAQMIRVNDKRVGK